MEPFVFAKGQCKEASSIQCMRGAGLSLFVMIGILHADTEAEPGVLRICPKQH